MLLIELTDYHETARADMGGWDLNRPTHAPASRYVYNISLYHLLSLFADFASTQGVGFIKILVKSRLFPSSKLVIASVSSLLVVFKGYPIVN
jgi:hypothetical protein